MKIRTLLYLLLAIGLASCATPSITLKNDATGQVARCGGSSSGSMAGGLIGHNMQKNEDQQCVRDYEAQGFKRIQ